MQAIFLTGDLMFRSRVDSAARTHGVSLATAANAELLLEKVADGEPRLVFVDLSAQVGDVAKLVTGVRKASTKSKIVAYAPHVHEQRLADATQAGCDIVLSRGQFNASFERLLAECADSSE